MVWTNTPDEELLCDECSEVLESGDEVLTTRQGKIREDGWPCAEFHNIYHLECAPEAVRGHTLPEQVTPEESS
jgi:hypothetical protein